MKKMLTYVPAFLFSLLLLITKPSGIIVAGFVFLVVLVMIAKYSRSQQEKNPCFRRTRPAKYDNMAFENNVRLQ